MWTKFRESNDLLKSLTVSLASPQTLSTAGLVTLAEKKKNEDGRNGQKIG